jgi:hypothetical protein
MTTVFACSSVMPASEPSSWVSVYSTWVPALRISRPSPTQTIGVMPAPSAATDFAATTASDSPWYSRRSEWPVAT